MTDYETLDLTALRDAPASLLDEGAPLGAQTFLGLPFAVGEGERAFVGFGAGLGGARSIPVGRCARTVLVAHRLLESRILEGGPVGVVVAEYAFRLADGREHAVPIRERFEIQMPLVWGQLPFRAVPDLPDGVAPRYEGHFGHAGRRQTGVSQAAPRGYYLWCWTNPTPDVPIVAIEVRPRGPRFLVAAVTLGHVDEQPLRRGGAQPVRVELDPADVPVRPVDPSLGHRQVVELAVDRGVAGYTWALPERDAERFLADRFAGWGEPLNAAGSPAYAEVDAAPSATLGVLVEGHEVERVGWGELLEKRRVERPRARIELVEEGRNWVETVVLDDATGQPIPCRVHFRSPHGVPYQPHGHHGHVNANLNSWHVDVGGDLRLGQISYAYVDGRCQGWLPRGEVIVDVARGYEYEPLRTRVTIEPGQRRLELRLRRMVDMNARRWFSGDTHVHFLSTQGGQREARGEDLNVVNLLLSQWGALFTNTEEFTGEPLVSRDGRTVVWATQENRQHLLGHLTLLGLKQHVYPWCSDGPSEAELGSTLETTLAAWADACHAQGGTVVLPHLPNPNGEPAALVATGRVDAVEMIRDSVYQHLEYYRYLNAGYRLPLVGGTDKMSSEVAVGQYRTYVRIREDEPFSYESWCRNLRLGRTFLSGGPLLELAVEGAEIGDTVRLPKGGGTVDVRATARSTMPIHTLQVVRGVPGAPGGCGYEVVAETTEPAGTRELRLSARVPFDGHGWLCARVGGPGYELVPHHDVWSRGVFGHTSPIYVACGEAEWHLADPAGLDYLLTLVGGALEYVRHQAPLYPAGRAAYHHGEPDHLAWLERPFREALEALHRRMHEVGIAH